MPEEIRTHLHQVRSFALEENESVITVTPRVSLDPRGGFLVADSRESQVRRYDDGGRLLSHFGRKGRGPGEFEHVSAALRTHDGGILTVDMGGRVAQFDGEGRTLLSTRQLPVTPVHEAAVVDDSTILVTGRRNVGNGVSLLHLWNRHTGELTRSFFPVPAHRPELAGAYAFAGTSDVAVKGDTAAAVFALSDTLYLFTTRGETIDRIPLPFERFRPVGPLPRSGEDFRAFQEWGESYSSVSQVYFAPGGGFLVEYYDLRGAEPQWRLLHVSRQGERIFESASARLMAVDLETGLLYFADPSSETLDRWVAFRLPA